MSFNAQKLDNFPIINNFYLKLIFLLNHNGYGNNHMFESDPFI